MYMENGQCKACHSTCLECHGAGWHQCDSCPEGKYLNDADACVSTCPDGTWENDEENECYPCHDSCLTCHGANDY
jgi:proprotein convertase subtilisin/kexin type 5